MPRKKDVLQMMMFAQEVLAALKFITLLQMHLKLAPHCQWEWKVTVG